MIVRPINVVVVMFVFVFARLVAVLAKGILLEQKNALILLLEASGQY